MYYRLLALSNKVVFLLCLETWHWIQLSRPFIAGVKWKACAISTFKQNTLSHKVNPLWSSSLPWRKDGFHLKMSTHVLNPPTVVCWRGQSSAASSRPLLNNKLSHSRPEETLKLLVFSCVTTKQLMDDMKLRYNASTASRNKIDCWCERKLTLHFEAHLFG